VSIEEFVTSRILGIGERSITAEDYRSEIDWGGGGSICSDSETDFEYLRERVVFTVRQV
jgi:hypothetical protein